MLIDEYDINFCSYQSAIPLAKRTLRSAYLEKSAVICSGETKLIAAMRALVVSVYGDTINTNGI